MLLLGGMLVIGEVERRHRGIVRRNRSEGESAPMTLGQALAAQVRLIVWGKSCWHRAEPDVAESGRALWRRNHRHRLGLPVDVFGLRWARGGFRRQWGGAVASARAPCRDPLS